MLDLLKRWKDQKPSRRISVISPFASHEVASFFLLSASSFASVFMPNNALWRAVCLRHNNLTLTQANQILKIKGQTCDDTTLVSHMILGRATEAMESAIVKYWGKVPECLFDDDEEAFSGEELAKMGFGFDGPATTNATNDEDNKLDL